MYTTLRNIFIKSKFKSIFFHQSVAEHLAHWLRKPPELLLRPGRQNLFHNNKKMEVSHSVVWAYILLMDKICLIIKKISGPNFRNVLKAILGLACITY